MSTDAEYYLFILFWIQFIFIQWFSGIDNSIYQKIKWWNWEIIDPEGEGGVCVCM